MIPDKAEFQRIVVGKVKEFLSSDNPHKRALAEDFLKGLDNKDFYEGSVVGFTFALAAFDVRLDLTDKEDLK